MKEQSANREWPANFCLAESRKVGIRPDTLSGFCRILLAFHQGDGRYKQDKDGFDVYASAFKATYSWGLVMEDAFNHMAWALADGSCLDVDRDNGRDIYKIIKGEVWERHKS